MGVYEINPSIIIYTNLIHISFYCRQPRKAELAFSLFKKSGHDGDALLYSKMVDGMIRMKQFNRVHKYVDLCIEEQCCLKEKTMKNLLKNFNDDETYEKAQVMKKFIGKKKKNDSQFNKMVNNYNLENPKKFKNEIHQQRKRLLNENPEQRKTEGKHYKGKSNKAPRGEIKLHNFRRN